MGEKLVATVQRADQNSILLFQNKNILSTPDMWGLDKGRLLKNFAENFPILPY